ncbi:MAG: metal-dependent transcriptional regulator, partial [Erysipelotrichaceae bacterium]|nr:metal-dependent transcriptional regulator [Erysipelotrichaceae bacterium]
MYLETILILSQKKDSVRSVDVVNKLKYKKSSVSVAMKNLREEGL